MTRAREDRLFEKYRKSGDVRALSKVFDRVAPVLWRIAVRLSADRHAAEDAVQGAFLAAIEDAADWDARRPLLPWLLGILTNQVRRTKRRAARELDRDRLRSNEVDDPSTAAEDAELRAAITAALAQVPAAYRETLELHLLRGAGPAEIAAATGRRPGTVRIQLQRGLAHVRRHLPKGVVAGAVIAMTPAVHAAMRQHVLGQAARSGVGLQMTLLGALAVNKTTSTLAALVVVSTLALVGWAAGLFPAGLDAAQVDNEPIALAADGKTIPQATNNETTDEATRRPLAHAPKADAATGEFVLRLVNSATNAPIPQVQLDMVVGGKIDYARTDRNGTVRREAVAGPVRARISTSSGLAESGRQISLEVVADKTTEQVVRIDPVLEFEVFVFDRSGKPVNGATVIGSTDCSRNLGYHPIGRTDATGRLAISSVLVNLAVGALAEGHIRSELRNINAKDRTQQRIELTIGDAAHTVTGSVFGPSRQPLAGILVALYPERDGPSTPPLLVTTDARGRFRSTNIPPGKCEVIAIQGHPMNRLRNESSHLGRAVCTVPTNARDVDVHITRGATVRGTVVVPAERRGKDGQLSVSVFLNLAEPLWGISQELANYGSVDRNGRFAIHGLMPGRYDLYVDRKKIRTVELRDGDDHRIDPPVQLQTAAITVRVLDPKDKPLHRWRVAVGPNGTQLQRTDAEGRCRIVLGPSQRRVGVSPPAGGSAVHTVDIAPGATEHVLRIPSDRMPTARITGRLVGANTDWSQAAIRLFRERTDAPYHPPEVRIDPQTGRFESGLLQPGFYAIAVSLDRSPIGHAGARHVAKDKVLDFGDVRVNRPASLLVIPQDDQGTRLRNASLAMRMVVQGRTRIGRAPARATKHGIRLTGVPADFEFDVLVQSPTTVPKWHTGVRLRAGEELRLPVTCVRGTPCVFARAAKPPHTIALRLTVRGADRAVVAYARLLPNRRVELGLAPGAYELEVRSGPDRETKRIVVPQSAKAVEFEVTAPRAKK